MSPPRYGEWRPLGPPQTEPRITPRILVFHTMVGYLRSTERMFRSGGYQGVESTFGVGGPWDGDDLDGVVWQWQDIGYQADAQAAGNAYCDSVETSDGGNADHPWSPGQLDALIKLTAWWCWQTDNPCWLVRSTGDHGIGYHRQFNAWNPNRHSCPGDVRLDQLLKVVIPGAAARLTGAGLDPVLREDEDMTMTRVVRVTDGGYFVVWPGATDLLAKRIPGPYGAASDEIRSWTGGQPILTMTVDQFKAMYTVVV